MDQTVRGGTKVTLTATQSNPDHLARNLQYTWTQTAGSTTGVQYAGADTATYTVTVPVNDNTATIPRTFQVVVTDTTVPGSSATDTVIVTADKTSLDHPVVDIFTWVSRQSGTVTVTAHTDLVADPNASMSLKFGSTAAFQKMTPVGTGQGQWTFTASKTAQPASVTVQTFIGTTALGQSTKTGLTAKKRSLGVSARFADVWDREVGSESFSV